MFHRIWRRGKAAALAPAGLAGTAAAVLLACGAFVALPASADTSHLRASATPAAVPWGSVGAGWVLAEYVAGTGARPGPTTLYLASPSGAKYAVYSWRASKTPAPLLVAWSGDTTRALLEISPDVMAQLNLRTGAVTRFDLPVNAMPAAYTRPHGLQLLVLGGSGSLNTLSRYDLAGKLVKVLVKEATWPWGIDTPDGSKLAVATGSGLLLISNTGPVIRKLRVPGVLSCAPVRWWNTGTILADCAPTSAPGTPQLWLVPANGARPAALTPVRKSGTDLGDIGAWRLPSGLYLQSLFACGALEINKQAANGSVTPVTVPGLAGQSPGVLTAAGPRLLIHTAGCQPGGKLVWFNPATKAETWLFKNGVEVAVPYYSTENAAN